MKAPAYEGQQPLRVSEDGKYAAYQLPDGGLVLCLLTPDEEPYEVGGIMDLDNFETAVDAAEEELRCLMADAAAEFGWG